MEAPNIIPHTHFRPRETMSYRELEDRRKQLYVLLAKLDDRVIQSIEYGSPKDMYLRFILIEFIPTQGGVQYAVRQITERGFGSGFYTFFRDEAVLTAMDLVMHAEKPLPVNIQLKMFEKGRLLEKKPLSFFASHRSALIGPGSTATHRAFREVASECPEPACDPDGSPAWTG